MKPLVKSLRGLAIHNLHPYKGKSGATPARATLVLAALAAVAGPNGWFLTGLTPTPYDHQRLMMVAGLLGLAILLIFSSGLRNAASDTWDRISPWARATLLGFFALGLISATRTPLPTAAFLEWGVFLLGTITALTLAGARRVLGSEADVLLLFLVIIGVAVYTGDFLAFYLPTVPVPDVTIFWTSPFFHFLNVRFFNQFQTWTLPLLAGGVVLAGTYSRFLAALLGLVGSFWWALLFATGGRGTLVAVILSTLLTLLFLRKSALRWAGTALVLVAGGVIIYIFLFHLPGGIPGIDRAMDKSGAPGQGRIQHWAKALQAAGAHPLLGVGPMQLFPGHPHNALLQVAAEWGIPAVLVAIVLVAGGLGAWLRRWRSCGWTEAAPSSATEAAVLPAVTASLLAGLGHGMVSGTLVMPVSQGLAVLVAGWMLGLHHAQHPVGEPHSGCASSTGTARVAIAAVTGAVALVPGFGLTLKDLPEAHETYKEQGRGRFIPRFWSQGDLCLPPWPVGEGASICPDSSKEGEKS